MEFKIDLKEFVGISSNSKEVEPGFIFVAISGEKVDGHKFIKNAIENGATLIVHQDEIVKQENVKYLKVNDTRLALSKLSSQVYPKQPKYILGVTGTSGKSSTVNFIREILKLLGKKAISIGSLGILGDIEYKPSSLNTPMPEFLHKVLDRATNENIDYVAIECSSHGIEQNRIASLKLSACGFTNFSQDHLDYHNTMEEYFAAKMKVFSLMDPCYVVLNKDINEFKRILEFTTKHKVIAYGKEKYEFAVHNIIIKSILVEKDKQLIELEIDGKTHKTELNLLGDFQVSNLACAIGLLMTAEINIEDIIKVVPMISTVPGRFEQVGTYNGANIFVDHAHKPDALEKVLINTRKFTKNNLWVVFGCGGDRDSEKRPLMGKIACEYADKIVITDDNPRTEDPFKIREAIIKSCSGDFIEISDRESAIKYAIERLIPGDNLIIAGKGHENYQIIGREEVYFSDQEVARKYITQNKNNV